MPETITAIGLMSGTSLDGVDVAWVETDGQRVHSYGASLTVPYEPSFRTQLRSLLEGKGDPLAIEKQLTEKHAEAVKALLKKMGKSANDVKVIGFHGQTIIHRPRETITWQLGNGALLASLTGINVVSDFRRRDMAEGGQGAPLVPVYHAALAHGKTLPVAIINIGGVANVTWIGKDGTLLAFDTGPGNALIDDWVLWHTGKPCDKDGHIAAAGKVDSKQLSAMLAAPYFRHVPPKSLDRNSFDTRELDDLSLEDGAATLTAFTVESIANSAMHFPAPAKEWFVSGGGRRNPVIMLGLKQRLNEVYPVESLGVDGDAVEAQAFAYLAVRSLYGLPLTFTSTTGAKKPVTGGAFYRV